MTSTSTLTHICLGLSILACSCAPTDGEEGSAELRQTEQETVFGDDSRQEYGELNSTKKRWARSVAAVFASSKVDCSGGQCTLSTNPWTSANRIKNDPSTFGPLCTTEPFYGQERGSGCSGALVAPDTILTARHCFGTISGASVNGQKWVFGFVADENGENVVTEVPESDVYTSVDIVHGGSDDWALITLDRQVSDRPVIPVRRSGGPGEGEIIHTLGFPTGLPLKGDTGFVRVSNPQEGRFEHSLDTVGGTSGSSVFNEQGIIQGVHVVGYLEEYVFSDPENPSSCLVSATCSETTGCPGFHRAELVSQASAEIPLFPAGIMAIL